MRAVSARSVLVIDPDEESASLIDEVLRAAGIGCRVVSDADTGWREFCRAPADVVVTALSMPRRDGAWLIRRLRDEYIGKRPPIYAIAADADLGPATRALELDAVLLRPVSAEALTALVILPAAEEATSRQVARFRELFELSLLHGDIDANIKVLLDRIARAFHVADCVLWGPAHEGRWPQTKRTQERSDDGTHLLWRCDLAVTAGSTLLVADGTAAFPCPVVSGLPTRSFLGVSLDTPGAAVGALCLIDDTPRRFSSEEFDALRALGRRLALELAWRSAHERLAAEHDRLRETALLDPLLGIWTRAALEEATNGEIARARKGNEPLSIAVVDVEQLRQINDRYGHVAGDAVLAHLSQVVRAALRPQDLVGRLGGDELGIVLPSTGPREAQELLHDVGRAVSARPLAHAGLSISVRVRIGATSLAPHDETAEEALARAAIAVRHARRARVGFHWSDAAPRGAAGSGPQEVLLADLDLLDVLPPGTTLGGMYQILHEISRGAMGVVYRAEDLGLGRPVAVKVLRADLARDAELVSRFRAEAAMLAALHHENLVGVYTFGAQGDEVYFVMELVEGEALSDLLMRADEAGEPLALDLVSSIVAQVAGALHAMHDAGTVHRDVKPANILLDRARDRAVLVDVGVAKRRGVGGDAAGTPGFAAPESFIAQNEGPATDVYGLAATAYMLLTGLAPFGGGDVAKVVRRQLHEKPAEPQVLRADLAPSVGKVLLGALSPAPRDRYQGALEFAGALAAALNERPEPLPPGLMPPPRIRSTGAMPTTTRRLARALAEVQPPQPSSCGNSRGVLFRVAYKILGNRLGSAWIRRACEHDPALAEVLRPTLAPLAWVPVERLIALLHAVPPGVRDPNKVSRELGRAAMTATFARFFGADPSSLSPAEVLDAGRVFWSRYHSWGRFVAVTRDGAAGVMLEGTPRDPLLCRLVEGMLERIAELSGGDNVQAKHVACETLGAAACDFEVTWGTRAI
jgi:diguanylate cyclase (GGDEF)-like protein